MACLQQIKVAALMKQELFKHRKLFGQLTLSYSSRRNTSPAARETREENIPGMLLPSHACSSAAGGDATPLPRGWADHLPGATR